MKGEDTVTCDEFRHFLDNYESLTETEKLMITAHAAECENCRNELDFMLSIISTAKTLPDIKVPNDFLTNLNARIDLEEIKERQQQRRVRRSMMTGWKHYSTVAACLLLVAVVGVNGKNLVYQMVDKGNDVITEERVSSDGNRRSGEQSESIAESSYTDAPAMEETNEPLASPSAEEPILPAIENIPAPINRSEKVSDQEVYKTVQSGSLVTSASQAPATIAPASTNQPVQYSEENNDNDIASEVELAEQKPESNDSTVTSEPYTVAKERYTIPIESIPYGNDTETALVDEADGNTVNGYSISNGGRKAELALGVYTPIDKDGNPTNYAINTNEVSDMPSGSSILVSSADEDKVKDLMNRYITGNYSGYYMTTEDKLNQLFEEMDKAGINYEKFIKNSSERVSFKLVIIS